MPQQLWSYTFANNGGGANTGATQITTATAGRILYYHHLILAFSGASAASVATCHYLMVLIGLRPLLSMLP